MRTVSKRFRRVFLGVSTFFLLGPLSRAGVFEIVFVSKISAPVVVRFPTFSKVVLEMCRASVPVRGVRVSREILL
jgi:hypothetical protein